MGTVFAGDAAYDICAYAFLHADRWAIHAAAAWLVAAWVLLIGYRRHVRHYRRQEDAAFTPHMTMLIEIDGYPLVALNCVDLGFFAAHLGADGIDRPLADWGITEAERLIIWVRKPNESSRSGTQGPDHGRGTPAANQGGKRGPRRFGGRTRPGGP